MKKILLLLAILVPLVSTSSFALTVPEKLVYDVSWTGIKAGTAVQEISSDGEGGLRIVSTTHSAPWLKLFFPVDDRIESLLGPSPSATRLGMPRVFRERINEGKTHTHKEARFHEKELKVVTKDFIGKTEKTDAITDRTYDTLSCIYFMRKCDLTPGNTFHIEVYDCKRLWDTEVKVLRREQISTPVGNFRTVVVRPILKFQGIFARTGEVTIWVTDDALRIPVKMTSKVKIGSITATLVGGSYWP